MIAVKPSLRDNIGMTIPDIIRAALSDNNELVAKLLDIGADINSEDEGFTILHVACMQGNRPLVELLLDRHRKGDRLDFTIRTRDRGLLAWQIAYECQHDDLAQLVVAAQREPIPFVPTGYRP